MLRPRLLATPQNAYATDWTKQLADKALVEKWRVTCDTNFCNSRKEARGTQKQIAVTYCDRYYVGQRLKCGGYVAKITKDKPYGPPLQAASPGTLLLVFHKNPHSSLPWQEDFAVACACAPLHKQQRASSRCTKDWRKHVYDALVVLFELFFTLSQQRRRRGT